MNRADRYKQYFTGDYLMGPNSFRLLDELIRRNPYEVCYDRTLDLGCGMALTSVFLARETSAKSVYAFDLWVNATDNLKRIRELSLAVWIPIIISDVKKGSLPTGSCRLSAEAVLL